MATASKVKPKRLERDWAHTWGVEPCFTLSTSGHWSSVNELIKVYMYISWLRCFRVAVLRWFPLFSPQPGHQAHQCCWRLHEVTFSRLQKRIVGDIWGRYNKSSIQTVIVVSVPMLTFSSRLRGVLHRSLRTGLPEGHRAGGSDHPGGGGPILWACEEVQRQKHQPVFPTGGEVLQVQPVVDKMVSGRCLFECVFVETRASWFPRPDDQLGGVCVWGGLLCNCRVFVVIILGLLVTWLVLDTSKRPEQLISFAGVCMFVLLLFLLSAHRTAVSSVSVSVCSCRGNGRFETRRDVIVARYLWLLLLRPSKSFALVPLSSSELSMELVELLPSNNSEFYGDYKLLTNLIVFFCCCVFRSHGGVCCGVWGYSSVLGFLLFGHNPVL